MMFGRRGIRRARREAELHPYRARFCEMFERLEREHGVTHYLAHNMTVTPAQRRPGRRGDPRLPRHGLPDVLVPARGVHREHEPLEGRLPRVLDRPRVGGDRAGRRRAAALPARFQIGDERCNRTAYGAYAGDRCVPLLDEDDPRRPALARGVLRGVRRDGLRRAARGARRPAGPRLRARSRARCRGAGRLGAALRGARGRAVRLARDGPRAVTFVMHSFMDARDVRPAWEALRRGGCSRRPARSARRRSACRPAPTRWRTRRPGRSCPPARSTRAGPGRERRAGGIVTARLTRRKSTGALGRSGFEVPRRSFGRITSVSTPRARGSAPTFMRSGCFVFRRFRPLVRTTATD